MQRGYQAIAAMAVEALELPLVAIDARRRVVLANASCEAILRGNESLARRDGRLVGRSADRDQALERILRRVGPGEAAVGRVDKICILGMSLGRARNLFLLLLVDPQRPLPCAVDHIGHLFDLSPAEARLAYALASGRTLMQHAVASNVALSTVRTQLRYVLRKSNLHRQSDLVRLIAGLPALRIR